MFYLTYVSWSTYLLPYEELVELLIKARARNEDKGITGMLIYKNETFIQVLEGERRTVVELFREIEKDPRHRNPVVVSAGEIEQRNFPDWSMGFYCMRWLLKLPIQGINDVIQRDSLEGPLARSNHLAVNLMRGFLECEKAIRV